jgi:hypothetical protein
LHFFQIYIIFPVINNRMIKKKRMNSGVSLFPADASTSLHVLRGEQANTIIFQP